MKLVVPLIAVVACRAPTSYVPAAPAPPVSAAPAIAPMPPVGPRVISDGPLRRVIEAPGAGMIQTLAITPDGKSVVTCDELGGVRLWPALDGTLEPRVVDLVDPKQLAIGPRAGGFTVVALDEVGGLVIANLDADGRTVSHVTLPGDPAFVGIEMTELGTLAWRNDQTIVLLGDDGTTKQRLGTEPGQRLVEVAATGRHAVAVVDTLEGGAARRRLRSIVLEPQLAWGPAVDFGVIDNNDEIAVSPSGKQVAILNASSGHPGSVRVIELATSTLIANEAVTTQSSMGFFDDAHLALASTSGLVWIDLDKNAQTPTSMTPDTFAVPVPHLVASGGRVVVAATSSLLLATPTDHQFLGYGLESPSVASAGADGALVVGLADTFVSLDGKLRASAGFDLGVKGTDVADLHWLGGKDWLVEGTGVDGRVSVGLAGSDGRKKQDLRTGLKAVEIMMSEPTTQLVTLSLGESPEVDHYDPKQRSITHLASLPKLKGYEQVELVPVSPSLAGGIQLIRVSMRDKMTVQWLRDPKALGTVASSVTIDGSLAAVDAAGRVYAWRNAGGKLELVTYLDGKLAATLPHDGPVALWPDPSGTRVVEIGQRSIAMYKVDGTLIWTQPLANASRALWLDDGAIGITSSAGIARLDATTGEVLVARCGWNFGLSRAPLRPGARIESLCAQLGR